jgi:hypothetical protein
VVVSVADHSSFEQLAAGYAVHALEPEDELAFQAHLVACPVCQRDLVGHEAALAALGHGASAEPPPALLAGIRTAVAAEPRAAAGPRPEPERPPQPAPVSMLRPRSWSVRRWPAMVAVAAAAALLVGLGGWNAALLRDREQQTARGDAWATAVEALQQDGARTVPLRGEGDVRVVAVLAGDAMSLVVDGLPPNPADTVYVMWAQDPSGAVRAVGTFDVDSTEVDVQRGMRLEDADQLARLMVTHEKGRTAPVTTDQPVLVSGSV